MSIVHEFSETYGFAFDPFQERACEALVEGRSVLVAAPTGAGKTVVGEFAAWLALRGESKTFYTTPIKALSNQKFGDFVELHGPHNVGLLTGDNSVNGDAPIVVMTTEVLRNMIYEDSSALQGLEHVVLDEVHYLQDRYRGAVWEEILIHLPVDVRIASLSATVSNAEEFAEWLQALRGPTEVVIEEKRPVDIRHWYYASDELLPMFVQRPSGDPQPNPRGREFDRRRRRHGPSRPGRGGRRVHEKRARIPLRTEVVERLRAESMLPGIYFIFSRRGCDTAVQQCLSDNVKLVTEDERREIVEYADWRVGELPPDELDVLGYNSWIEGLSRGVAAHHAGMIPPFKETVEELFARGLIKAVFATETLALGINMPARTVVIESLMKFTGEKHELMTPGQYTQLSGRAGRRGIDELGHCVVLLQRFTPFDTISRLASTRTYPLQSSFQPSYNMAVNLVRSYDRPEAEHLVNSSFAQFQADRAVVQLEQTKERSEAYLATYRERASCELGDFREYETLLTRIDKAEAASRPSKRYPEPQLSRDDQQLYDLLEAHPCHKCPERKRHIHFSARAVRLERKILSIDRQIKRRTGTLARRFERVLQVLEHFHYVEGWELTDKGQILTGVYNESDLLVVEALERRLFDDLSPADLAAVCSSLVYETRGPEAPELVHLPTKASEEAWKALIKLWKQIRRDEDKRALELTREPDPGFAEQAYMWATGAPLDDVLGEDDAPGDFVRSVKQLVDLLKQLADVAPAGPLARTIDEAIKGLHRGVVAYSSL